MGGDRNPADVLRTAADRQRVFEELEGGATRSDIQAALDVSRSTAHRVAKTFESLELAVRRNGFYELTPFGRVVGREVDRATNTIRVADSLAPLLGTFQDVEEPIDLYAFEDATVTEPEAGDPYSPMRRFLSLVEDASRIREFSPTAPEPAYQNAVYDRVQEELQAAMLFPAPVVDRLRRDDGEKLERAFREHDLDVRVGDLPAFRLVLADERVYLGGYNENASHLRIVADTARSDAVEWAVQCFRNHWEKATSYDAYLENEDRQ